MGTGDTQIVYKGGAVVYTVDPYLVSIYRYFDLDGDSLLLSSSATVKQALAFYENRYPGGRTESTWLGIDAGEDGAFDTETDNKVISASYLNALGSDTIAFYSVKDADGDGFADDHQSGSDSGLIDVYAVWGAAPERPLVQRSSLNARFVVFSTDKDKNYTIRYRISEEYAGRTKEVWAQTIGGDSVFLPFDTIDIFQATLPAVYDSLGYDTVSMRVVLGNLPHDSTDDALLGISVHSTKRLGWERECVFTFDSYDPVFTGARPQNGDIYLKIVNENGTWLEALGTVSTSGMDARVTASNGKLYTVKWDTDGKLLEIK